MKILICYFSGTGNTQKVVNAYVDQFKKSNCDVDLWRVEDSPFPFDPSQYDKIGIAYPIHAFNAPKIILNFGRSLPKLASPKPLFIIKTSGEPLKANNISSKKLLSIVRKKGYLLNNEYHYVMPYNMIFRHSNAMAYKMWDTAKKLIPIDSQEILSGKQVKLSHVFMGSFLAWVMRIQHWGAKVNGKLYKVTDKCVKCQKCVRNCPTQNITIKDGHFEFGNKCIMCMRCSFHCPTDAFKIGFLNGWKVNGAYVFDDPNNTYQKSHKNWCKKSYAKYFARSNQKIAQNTAK